MFIHPTEWNASSEAKKQMILDDIARDPEFYKDIVKPAVPAEQDWENCVKHESSMLNDMDKVGAVNDDSMADDEAEINCAAAPKSKSEKHRSRRLRRKRGTDSFNMPCEEYVQPEIGTMWIFPKWLHHQVMPFYGGGERRSLGMNWNVIETQGELQKIMSPSEYESFVDRIPDDWNREDIYPMDIGGAIIHVKLDND